MQRNSQQDTDPVAFGTVGLPLGKTGLDLRTPTEPASLSELLNARFVDDRTVRQRSGYLGYSIQDASSFAALGPDYAVGDSWVYGHGMRVSSDNAAGWENAHHPIAGQGKATFRYRDADIAWTGDRLLVMRGEETALGDSAYWHRAGSTSLPYGVPAYLPLQTDSAAPLDVEGEYVNTCLSEKYRAFVSTKDGPLIARIVDRDTHAAIDTTDISGGSSSPVEPMIFDSGGFLVVLWRGFDDRSLWMSHWTGQAWTTASAIVASVAGFDVALVPGGFHLVYRADSGTEAPSLTRFAGVTVQANPYGPNTALAVSDTGSGQIAIAVAPGGDIAVARMIAGGTAEIRSFEADLTPLSGWVDIGACTRGLTLGSRGLRDSDGEYEWVAHMGTATGVRSCAYSTLLAFTGTTSTRFNSSLASKAFRVGDEVFCWYRSGNAGTHYLISGARHQTVCGFADREEAITLTTHDANLGLPSVLPDPNDDAGYLFTWARTFNTGQAYDHGGSTRVGDLNFLPDISTVQYGRSVYLSGCAVRNWDGEELGDAGWQDYPVITSDPTSGGIQSTGGFLTLLGTYYYRAKVVRYNARGERFESAARTFGPVVMTGSNDKLTLDIAMVPDTNHSDAIIEIYRTESLGTTFYLDGYIQNDLTVASVSYVSTLADRHTPILSSDLIEQEGDPTATGVGNPAQLETWGPLGCSMLAIAGDRLWGAGGQVSAGFVQFSKLHEDGSGAGFDDLAGFQEMNTEGQAITSLTPLNDAAVIFERDRLYVLSGVGPDNFGRGSYDIPQVELADGAITHVGTVSTQLGALFWGVRGPRLLTTQFQVISVGAPMVPLTESLTPTGVQVDLSRQEVVWYTSSGDAVLWNYLDGTSRWARWTGLRIAGVSPYALATTDGRLLYESPAAKGDAGQAFPFTLATGLLRPEALLQGATQLRMVGIAGTHDGPHSLRFRVYYNGSPLWSVQDVWDPADGTWLTPTSDVSTLTAAQVDALLPTDHSGQYITSKRVTRQTCHYFRVELSNIEADAPTFTPFELSLELAAKPGLGRVPTGTFS